MIIETEQAFRPLVIKLETLVEAAELLDALRGSPTANRTERVLREALDAICS